MGIDAEIEEAVSWEAVVNVGVEIVQHGSESQWLLGRLANRIGVLDFHDPNLSGKTKTLKAFSAEIRQSYEIVKDAARVVANVPDEMRVEFAPLSFGHWREITRRSKARDRKTLRTWASRAADMEWTVTKLREELRGVTDQDRKATDHIKLMRRAVGVCRDLSELDFNTVWVQEPDEVTDLVKSLNGVVAGIESARADLSGSAG